MGAAESAVGKTCWYDAPQPAASAFKALYAFRHAAIQRDADDGLADRRRVRLLGIDPLSSILCGKYGSEDPTGRSFEVACAVTASYPRSNVGGMTFVLAPEKIDAKLHCWMHGANRYRFYKTSELKAAVDLRPMSDREKLERPGSLYESPREEVRDMLANIFAPLAENLTYVCRAWGGRPDEREDWNALVEKFRKNIPTSKPPIIQKNRLAPMSALLKMRGLGRPTWNQVADPYSLCVSVGFLSASSGADRVYRVETMAFTDSVEPLNAYTYTQQRMDPLLRLKAKVRKKEGEGDDSDQNMEQAMATLRSAYSTEPLLGNLRRSLSFVGRSRESVAVTSRALPEFPSSWTISRSCLYETATEASAALEESWEELVDAAEMRDSEVDEYIPPNKVRKNNALQTKVRLLGIDPLSRVVGDDCHPSDEAVFQVVCELTGGSWMKFPNSQNMVSLVIAAESISLTITCTIKDGIGSRMINAKEANVDLRHMSEREIEESNEDEEREMDSWRQYLSVMGVSTRAPHQEMLIRIFMNEFTKKQVTVCRRWLTEHAPQDSAAAWKTVVERTKIILTANPKKKEPHSVPLATAFLELDQRQTFFGPAVWSKPPPAMQYALCLRIEEIAVEGESDYRVVVKQYSPDKWHLGGGEVAEISFHIFTSGEVWRQVAFLRSKVETLAVEGGRSKRTTTRKRKVGDKPKGPEKGRNKKRNKLLKLPAAKKKLSS